uniref:Uncharacterized protein n=1 Tax=Neobodo designis TaxID=312471 RepID=A0A6U4UGE5_NEODS|mmetsp:Transcript_39297/g.121487  ORF Transcript_39297/g.121487 Transcript_39297/m.121487 type:complete len:101 (+) Transcript_39297:45-347(+)
MSATRGTGANRWLSKQLWQCGRCHTLTRHVEGYRPIDNPVLYDAWKQDADFDSGKARAVGSRGHFMKHCDRCGKMHGAWTHVDFQQALDHKETVGQSPSE